ncbi:MAG: hypothetical protein ACOYCD_10390 [Kiritimatiellia bacterium]
MLRVLKLASLMMVLALAIAAMPFKPVSLLHEDFSGYPPTTTNTMPDGFVTVYGAIVGNNKQEFNYDLWPTHNIVRWKIERVGPSSENRRLVYVGDGGVDPSQWSNYTAYTSFEITNAYPDGYKVHLMARLQGNSTSQQGYTAIYNGYGGGALEQLPRRLVIRKDDFFSYVTNVSDPKVIAYSTNTFSIKSNVVYTLKFEVQGEKLNAYFYEGTNLAAPGALKMTASGTDSDYSTGTAAMGMRVGGIGQRIYYYNLTVDGPPPNGSLFSIY